jgi:hypothetical protein
MPATASHIAAPLSGISGRRRAEYEQPLNERMRTFMRLEFLYRQMLYNIDLEADWATRAATGSLLEIIAILGRGEVRSDVHKELDYQVECLKRYKANLKSMRPARTVSATATIRADVVPPNVPATARRTTPQLDQAPQLDSRRHLRIRSSGIQPLAAATF